MHISMECATNSNWNFAQMPRAYKAYNYLNFWIENVPLFIEFKNYHDLMFVVCFYAYYHFHAIMISKTSTWYFYEIISWISQLAIFCLILYLTIVASSLNHKSTNTNAISKALDIYVITKHNLIISLWYEIPLSYYVNESQF